MLMLHERVSRVFWERNPGNIEPTLGNRRVRNPDSCEKISRPVAPIARITGDGGMYGRIHSTKRVVPGETSGFEGDIERV